MAKAQKQSSYDRHLNWLKNKFAIIILLAGAIIALGSVTDSIDKIFGFFSKHFDPESKIVENKASQPNQVHKLSTPTYFNRSFISDASSGSVKFNYSNNNGRFIIGQSFYLFETKWSKASDRSIHVYNDPASIIGVALAHGISDKAQISDASNFDMSSRTRTPQENEFVVLKNVNGYFAVLRILDVKDRTRADNIDELSFEYWIQKNKTSDFSNLK